MCDVLINEVMLQVHLFSMTNTSIYIGLNRYLTSININTCGMVGQPRLLSYIYMPNDSDSTIFCRQQKVPYLTKELLHPPIIMHARAIILSLTLMHNRVFLDGVPLEHSTGTLEHSGTLWGTLEHSGDSGVSS